MFDFVVVTIVIRVENKKLCNFWTILNKLTIVHYIKAPVYLQLSDFLFSGGLHRVSWTETQMDYNTTSNKGQGKNVQYIVGQYGPLRLPNRYVIVQFHAFPPLNSFWT